ncbi:HXXEE domain-containing protein [Streptomyces sp. NPDC052109]|uniref:HXXEE domain-containing protein n=1 Tax=Streptomyces sp. NPDC052109 TaxID=3155527 RepID=UPI003424FFF1
MAAAGVRERAGVRHRGRGLVHPAQADDLRGYTPGSATTPLAVLPFGVWARGRLRRSGVLRPTRPRDLARGLAFAAAAAVGTHAPAQGVLRRR